MFIVFPIILSLMIMWNISLDVQVINEYHCVFSPTTIHLFQVWQMILVSSFQRWVILIHIIKISKKKCFTFSPFAIIKNYVDGLR